MRIQKYNSYSPLYELVHLLYTYMCSFLHIPWSTSTFDTTQKSTKENYINNE